MKDIKLKDGSKVTVLERDILIVQHLANDCKPLELAEMTGLSKRTIEGLLDGIRAKYGLKSLAGLVATFYREKLIH